MQQGGSGHMPGKSTTLIIFGATGDLAHRMLFPSLYNLFSDGLLPEGFAMLASGRTAMDDQAFQQDITESLKAYLARDRLDEARLNAFVGKISYCAVDVGDSTSVQCLVDRNLSGADCRPRGRGQADLRQGLGR